MGDLTDELRAIVGRHKKRIADREREEARKRRAAEEARQAWIRGVRAAAEAFEDVARLLVEEGYTAKSSSLFDPSDSVPAIYLTFTPASELTFQLSVTAVDDSKAAELSVRPGLGAGWAQRLRVKVALGDVTYDYAKQSALAFVNAALEQG